MNLVSTEYGSWYATDDPGEPTTGTRRISVTHEEAAFLAFLATGRDVVEVGTGLGVSTRAMAETARHVTTCDIDPWVQANIWPTLDAATCERPRDLPDSAPCDMVFIDGAHTTEQTEADVTWASLIVNRGIIVVHDANMASVRAALDDSWHIVPTYHGMAIRYVGWD